jgi:hypothetical protein
LQPVRQHTHTLACAYTPQTEFRCGRAVCAENLCLCRSKIGFWL